ncbi:PREDICTED: pentatricopeptide repeat-containing protein At2g27800, mitochondrial-like isoform X1 [Nelumbo nucifera]|uniref:Pentatricopeptide repeat-containing protein At2g27800, mitochondrial-like isoform X1 n=1 Tax=Nelumbo nucifera TaxID=4432 RepID=A0A1U8AW68_NELNU|nr:PREDICTED: pentatricopeptide repeat-containing protein At2g27800, mitochondrial-like isoform X1 [Nelumbo nucifera]XP_010272259.1 PREDICTED: pentatricopeptide repeat-containing protein At2g27800, mitochondrial-like isoform X1 [Nelumbo nucifera]
MVSVLRVCSRPLCCSCNGYINQQCYASCLSSIVSTYDKYLSTCCSSKFNDNVVQNFTQIQLNTVTRRPPPNTSHFSECFHVSFYSSHAKNTTPRRYLKKGPSKNLRAISKSTFNQAQFQNAISQLPHRFTPEDLYKVITLQDDPQVCLEIFNWASQQPRFRHDVSTYHITIKKLGSAKFFQEMDDVVNQVLAVPSCGSEALFNTIIYFFTEARKLSRAINVYKYMRRSKDSSCKPSVRTYNILFAALLGRGSNTYINYMYMDTISCLFKQMVNDGIEPDIFSLNFMIKGYAQSLHVNDALRVFHQMGVVYNCLPNSHTYNYLIHGLCVQGRTVNAKELYEEMKNKGFVPSSKAYNSLVNCFAINGEIEEAEKILWEVAEKRVVIDFITYQTVLNEICRQGMIGKAMLLLNELQEKDLVDGHAYRKLLCGVEDEFRISNCRN